MPVPAPATTRVIVLAGPSGSGKSRLAERLGLRTLRLDDFYRDGDDPALPTIGSGANAGLVDWDHVDSWRLEDAVEAIEALCRDGAVDVPHYDLSQSSRVGSGRLELGGDRLFIAEGIFAPEIVPACERAGVLAAAYCLTQHPMVTFWRRLTRDLREHRKPPLVLVRRGLSLARDQRRVIEHAVALGCRPVGNDEAFELISGLKASVDESQDVIGSPVDLTGLRQPDGRSCGAAVLVASRLVDAAGPSPDRRGFGEQVLRAHRELTSTAGNPLPWPRALGTPPWSLARRLGRRRVRLLVTRRSRVRRWPEITAALRGGGTVPMYVGNRLLPRHVVLALGTVGDRLRIYEPSKGVTVAETRDAVIDARLEQSGWRRPWLALLPR